MRTIIRFSLNNDHGSRLRNSLYVVLHDIGLELTGTATYEGDVDEMARMLGGEQVTDTSRRHARELLKGARAAD
jgi:hypothetical protein